MIRFIFVGAINIRYYLNENSLFNGGHIGDGIAPSERNKGFHSPSRMSKIKDQKVLMCCDKEDTTSARTIIKNGDILESKVLDNRVWIQRYWIEL